MDTTDPEIYFDELGNCNHCNQLEHEKKTILRKLQNQTALKNLITEISNSNLNGKYNCVVGISGGTDSCFVLHSAVKLGLKPLAVHVDNGWNSEVAVSNIEKIIKKLDVDLHTEVLDWAQFKNLQRAFLRSGTKDCEVPTDHLIRASLVAVAKKYGIKYSLNGRNYSTEGIMPVSWSYGAIDWKYIKSVNKIIDGSRLDKLNGMNLFSQITSVFQGMKSISMLIYIDFDKEKSMELLSEKYGWQAYTGKHYESLYTKWYQGYYLFKKFCVDKRKAHLSVLICNGNMSRERALAELKTLPYDIKTEQIENDYIKTKLEMRQSEVDELMQAENKTYVDYPNNSLFLNGAKNKLVLDTLVILRQLKILPSGFADRAIAQHAAKKQDG